MINDNEKYKCIDPNNNISVSENYAESAFLEVYGTNNKVTICGDICYTGNISIYIYGDNNEIIIDNCELVGNLNIFMNANSNTTHLEEVTVENSLWIYNGSTNKLELAENSKVFIGKNTSFQQASIHNYDSGSEVYIDEGCEISSDVLFYNNAEYDVVATDECAKNFNSSSKMYIGKNVKICEQVKLLKGASINDNSLVKEFSTVSDAFDKKAVFLYGNPVRIVEENINWSSKRERTVVAKKPTLSICIPTYNRAQQLRKTLEILVSDYVLRNTYEVEIVISDNASTDETQKVCAIFVNKYPDKIKYFRNEENVRDKNFYLVLERATGKFRKLHSDKMYFLKDALLDILSLIRKNEHQKPVLFFLNNHTKLNVESIKCKNYDEFLESTFFELTVISLFGMWEEDFETFRDAHVNYSASHLAQMKVFEKHFDEGRELLIYNRKVMDGWSFPILRTEKFLQVFVKNYDTFYEDYYKKGFISAERYKKEKKRMFFDFLIPAYFSFSPSRTILRDSYMKNTVRYQNEIYFYYGTLYGLWLKFKSVYYKKASYRLKILYHTYSPFGKKTSKDCYMEKIKKFNVEDVY